MSEGQVLGLIVGVGAEFWGSQCYTPICVRDDEMNWLMSAWASVQPLVDALPRFKFPEED